jgi:plastocyanin
MPVIRYALLGLALAAAAPAAPPERVEVALANFKFTPATIRFKHGQQYLLHLSSTGGHSFAAKAFFAAATIPAADRARITNGKIDLAGGESVDIHLTAPAPGSYPVTCSHFLHASFGMTGKIIVD